MRSLPDPDELATAWERFAADRSVAARNSLIMGYRHLVERAVHRLPATLRTHWELADLESFATLGLIDAIERWVSVPEPRAERFEAYASKRIRGEVFDQLRALDWLPRVVRRRVSAYGAAHDDLVALAQRSAHSSEIVVAMGLDPQRTAAITREVQSAQLLSLEQPKSPDSDPPLASLASFDPGADPELLLLAREQTAALRRAIDELPSRQHLVITLYYFGDLSQRDIAKLLGVSDSRVSQIQAAAYEALRRRLAPTSTGAASEPT